MTEISMQLPINVPFAKKKEDIIIIIINTILYTEVVGDDSLKNFMSHIKHTSNFL